MKDISRVESIQRSYTKAAFRRCGIAFSSYGDRLRKVNLKSLEERRLIFDLVLTYKIVHGQSDLNFNNYFAFNNSSYNLRRHSLQIKCNKNHVSLQWRNSFFVRVVNIWNSLTENIVRANSIYEFKSKMNNFSLREFTKLRLN